MLTQLLLRHSTYHTKRALAALSSHLTINSTNNTCCSGSSLNKIPSSPIYNQNVQYRYTHSSSHDQSRDWSKTTFIYLLSGVGIGLFIHAINPYKAKCASSVPSENVFPENYPETPLYRSKKMRVVNPSADAFSIGDQIDSANSPPTPKKLTRSYEELSKLRELSIEASRLLELHSRKRRQSDSVVVTRSTALPKGFVDRMKVNLKELSTNQGFFGKLASKISDKLDNSPADEDDEPAKKRVPAPAFDIKKTIEILPELPENFNEMLQDHDITSDAIVIVPLNSDSKSEIAKDPLKSGVSSNNGKSDNKKGEDAKTPKTTEKKESDLDDELYDEAALPKYVNNEQSYELPSYVPYLIIGGGTAGMSAARAIRATDSNSRVLIISSEKPGANSGPGRIQDYPPYRRPPLSKDLWRLKPTRQQEIMSPKGDMRVHSWLYYEPSTFFLTPERLNQVNYGGVGLWQGRRVVHLDPFNRTARLDNGHTIKYHQCLIATGGKPRKVQHLDHCLKSGKDLVESGKVSYFRTIDDFRRLFELAESYSSKGGRIAVVGGGFLGSELAVSLGRIAKKNDKLKVMQVFREMGNISQTLPDYLAEYTRDFIKAQGVDVHQLSEVASVTEMADGRLSLDMRHFVDQSEKERQIVDHIIVAMGIEAITDLADCGGMEVDPVLGGYLVNSELEARSGVFVAGDACSFYDPLLGRRRVEHIDHAEESGKLAGRNMAKSAAGPMAPFQSRDDYKHQTSFWSNLGPDLTWEAVGLVDSRYLDSHGFFAHEAPISSDDGKPTYESPGVVIYTHRTTGRVMGILLWNLPDEIYQDKQHFAPGRLNLARQILAEKRIAQTPEELAALAREFDVFETIDDDYQELKTYAEKLDERNSESEDDRNAK